MDKSKLKHPLHTENVYTSVKEYLNLNPTDIEKQGLFNVIDFAIRVSELQIKNREYDGEAITDIIGNSVEKRDQFIMKNNITASDVWHDLEVVHDVHERDLTDRVIFMINKDIETFSKISKYHETVAKLVYEKLEDSGII